MRVVDFILVLAPFILAWWLAGWPGKADPVAVKAAGLSFLFFGASMLLRLAVFGRQMPAGKYSGRLMTTGGTVGFCVFIAAVGVVVLLAHSWFAKRR
ncbi:hypothetical protein DBV14_31790 [Variovorax sp. KBW07]|nr:hypothetical protein DBV14_31790 [Variovorax sp. KBW07]